MEVVDDILDFIATEEVAHSGRSDGEKRAHGMWDGTGDLQTLDDFPTWT